MICVETRHCIYLFLPIFVEFLSILSLDNYQIFTAAADTEAPYLQRLPQQQHINGP